MLTKGASHIASRSTDAPWWEVSDEICLPASLLVVGRVWSEHCSLNEQDPDRPPSGRRLRGHLEPPATLLGLQPFPGLRPGRALFGSPPLLPLDQPAGDERGRNALGAGVFAQPARRMVLRTWKPLVVRSPVRVLRLIRLPLCLTDQRFL